MKSKIMNLLGLKGSWAWAKKQMLDGKMVRCEHWSGALKYRIDNPENKLLQMAFCRLEQDVNWKTATHHLRYEDLTDYVVFEWPKKK
jgi:hypothetical protein